MSNYTRGRAYEYRTMRMLEAVQYGVARTAGSHGAFDVLAFNRQGFRLIQVKSHAAALSPAERETFKNLIVPPRTTKEVWSFSGKRGAPPRIQVL